MTVAEDFWSRRASRYDVQLRHDEVAYNNRVEAALRLLGENDWVLDIGCATGEIGLDLARRIARYDGCDPAVGMINLAREKARDRCVENARFFATTAFDRAFRPGTYDAVLALSVLHLVPDAEALLHRIQKLLRPGGMLIVETPCLGEQNAFKRLLIRFLTLPIKELSIRSLRYSEVETLVRGAGLEIIQVREAQAKDRMQWVVATKNKHLRMAK